MPPENYDISTHRLKAGCSASELRGLAALEKTCGTCRKSKPLAEFNRKRSRPDGLQEVCRECNRESSRRYYAQNREKHVQRVAQRTAKSRAAAKAFLATYLREHPCVDCGNGDLRVLDFDHRPDSGKSDDVMRLVAGGYGIPRLLEEIAKCDVRCRNCHAIITLERGGDNWRWRAMKESRGETDRLHAADPGRTTPAS